jgi:hypothetical protein
MPLLDETRAAKLIELARASFDPELSEAEEQVLRQSASSGNPPRPEAEAPRLPIRPEFVRWLATSMEAAAFVDPKGIRLYSVTIPGDLDLEECRVLSRLDFGARLMVECSAVGGDAGNLHLDSVPGPIRETGSISAAGSCCYGPSVLGRFGCSAHKLTAIWIAGRS